MRHSSRSRGSNLIVLSMAGVVIMGIAYGLDVRTKDDVYVAEAVKAVHILLEVTQPGAFAVNVIPALKHIPEWLPGESMLWS